MTAEIYAPPTDNQLYDTLNMNFRDITNTTDSMGLRIQSIENAVGYANVDGVGMYSVDPDVNTYEGLFQKKLKAGSGIVICPESGEISIDLSLIPEDYNELQSENKELESENVALRSIIEELKEQLGLPT